MVIVPPRAPRAVFASAVVAEAVVGKPSWDTPEGGRHGRTPGAALIRRMVLEGLRHG